MPVMLDSPVAVRRAAMDLLARREHSRAELTRKLRQRGAAVELIDSALERLSEEGLLSDERFLESFIRSRAQAGYGPLRIRDELSQRGLPRAIVERALADSPIEWAANLRELWRRRFAALPVDARERAKQGRFLLYRGFAHEAVSRLLRGGDEE
ncbi:recombination regulator RecX [Pseudomonas sp. MAP12]|uniref:Regulatory protein RecX n=1 Tax=Geopseudomonas aromaticivorans TaxID=2849492 RepID=A0ABS6MT46_9GAMM|nr:recombination regulator RecX [Pseudomonas aromaticivorans]MBV2131569.1 recombination regulator RecX [Pseudomonas aromaticivorans]